MKRDYSFAELAELANQETDPVRSALFELIQAAVPYVLDNPGDDLRLESAIEQAKTLL